MPFHLPDLFAQYASRLPAFVATGIVTFSLIDKVKRLGYVEPKARPYVIPLGRMPVGLAILTEVLACIAMLSGIAEAPALLSLSGYILVLGVTRFESRKMGSRLALMGRKGFATDLSVAGALTVLLTTSIIMKILASY